MKKSKNIRLVLITAALASCHHTQPEWHGSATYIRSDSTAPYTRMNYYHPDFNGKHPVLGSWIIGQEPAGMGIRESDSLVTDNLSRFIPHLIIT